MVVVFVMVVAKRGGINASEPAVVWVLKRRWITMATVMTDTKRQAFVVIRTVSVAAGEHHALVWAGQEIISRELVLEWTSRALTVMIIKMRPSIST